MYLINKTKALINPVPIGHKTKKKNPYKESYKVLTNDLSPQVQKCLRLSHFEKCIPPRIGRPS